MDAPVNGTTLEIGAQHPPRDAASVFLRPVRPGDGALLDGLVRSLSDASRYRRFHAVVNELSEPWRARLTRVAPDEAALLAIVRDGGREIAIGEARYATGEDAAAEAREFALVVADDWQGLGVGARLLRGLLRCAERAGVRVLYGDVFADNAAMLAFARRLGFSQRRHPTDARLVRVVSTLLQAAETTAPVRRAFAPPAASWSQCCAPGAPA
jgi:acetyltransferase